MPTGVHRAHARRLRSAFGDPICPTGSSAIRCDVRRYDPLKAPEPEEWLLLDESERIRLAAEYHRRARIRLSNRKLHAQFHVIAENQIALGDKIPVRRTLVRLMEDGLDRHEAIHAIGLVLGEHMYDLVHGAVAQPDPNQPYFTALDRLTAEEWRRSRSLTAPKTILPCRRGFAAAGRRENGRSCRG